MSNSKLFTEFPPVTTEQWEAVIQKDLKGADYEKKLIWKTPEGFNVKPYYRAEDLTELSYLQANPGEFPYIRGNQKESNDWIIRQDISSKDVKTTNLLAVDALNKGAQSVGLRVKQVETMEQMSALLQGINVETAGIHFTSSKNYVQTLNLFVQYLEKNNIDAKKVNGSINFDPFNYALQHGKFYGSLESNLAEAKEIFTQFASKLPNFKFITINAQYFHNAGSTLTQELGMGLAVANEYIYALTSAGISIDELTPRFVLHLATGSNYFMEIAKIRAARLLWSKIVEQYQPKSEESSKIFIHSSSSLWNKSVYDPYVNMLRTTTESMSSVIGGADSIFVLPFDRTYKNEDDFSARISRNQQILLKEESYMDKIADPSAGSYYIENLTDSIAHFAWKIFQTIEEKGGAAKCIENDYIQNEVKNSAAQKDLDIATRKIIILGTNQYPNAGESMLDKVQGCGCGCEGCCGKDENPKFAILKLYRGAEAFEKLRLDTEKFVQKGNKKPAVFMLTYGNLAMRKARAGFASNFFGCTGYDIIDNLGFETPEEGAQAALSAKAEIVVLCSSDDEYAELVAKAAPLLKGKTTIILAGAPTEAEAFKAAGIEEFINVKSNLLQVLQKFQSKLIK